MSDVGRGLAPVQRTRDESNAKSGTHGTLAELRRRPSPRPRTVAVVDADAVVIGAGVVGSSIALELQRGGRDVVVVDRAAAVGAGSTGASSAIVRFTYSTWPGIVASAEAMHRWVAWERHLGVDVGPLAAFHRIGMLHIPAPGHDLATMRARFDRVGVRHEMLDAAALARRYPALDVGRHHPPRLATDPGFDEPPHGEVEALLMHDAGFVDDPALAAANLAAAAQHHGARILLRTTVTAVEQDGGRVSGVAIGGGETIGAPVVVNAAGPWSRLVNAMAGVLDDMAITTRALRQDVAATVAPDGFGVGSGGAVVADMDLGAYSRPQPGGSYLIGGVEADCDPVVWVDDPDEVDPHPDPEMFETLVHRAARRIPDLAVPRRPQGLAACYDVTDDWVPVYDRTSLDGFYVAAGTSGNQFKNAPLVGDAMRALIDACEAGHDHDAEPVQVDCPHVEATLDLGHYSRRRDPVPTSGTVMG